MGSEGNTQREKWRMSREDIRAWKLFLRYYRPHVKQLVFYATASSFASALIVPVFYLVRFVFDVAIPASNISLLVYAGLGIVAVRMLSGALTLWLRRYVVRLIKLAITDL